MQRNIKNLLKEATLVKKEIKEMYFDLLNQVEKELGLSKEIWLWKPWYVRILSFLSIPIPLSKREELFLSLIHISEPTRPY